MNEIQSLVSSWVQKENVSFPSFDQTYLRYQSYIQIEKSNTALNNSAGSNGQSCYLKAELWGRPMAESGRPNTLVPSPVTLQAYKSCVDTTSHLVYTKLSRSFDGKSLTQIISLVIDEVIGPQVLSKRSQNFLVKKLEAVAQSSTKAQAKIQSAGSTPQVENYSYITINAVIAAALTDYNYLVY